MPKDNRKSTNTGLVNKLWFALECGSPSAVKQVINQGAPVNHVFKEVGHRRQGQTPLTVAVAKNNCALVKLLVSLYANLEQTNSHGETALFTAISRGKMSVIHELIRQGCKINHTNCNYETVLFHAIRIGRKDLVELLISRGADVNVINKNECTPLLLALELFENMFSSLHATRKTAPSNMIDISCLLIPLCRNLNHEDPNKGTALRIALNIEAHHLPHNLTLSKLLLQYGARPDSLFFLRYGGLLVSTTKPNAEFLTEKFFDMAILAGANLHQEKAWMRAVFLDMPEALEPFRPLFRRLLERASSPLTMHELCSIRLRYLLHGQLWTKVDALPLPNSLKKHLKLLVD